MSLYKIASIQRNRVLQKEASFLLTTAAGHVAQNVAADVAINKGMFGRGIVKSLSPETKKLNKFQKGKKYLTEGLKGFVMPEGSISEEHAREIHDKIRKYPYKKKVLAVHALEGDWSKISQSEEGKKALKEHLKTISPNAASVLDYMRPEQIANMEEAYKNHPMGKNMIHIAKSLKGIDKIKHKKENLVEAGLNTAIGTIEPGVAIVNSAKRVLGSTDKLTKPIKTLQAKVSNRFFKKPIENTVGSVVENGGKISKKEKIKNVAFRYAANAVTAHMQNMGAKVMEAGMKDMTPTEKIMMSEGMKNYKNDKNKGDYNEFI